MTGHDMVQSSCVKTGLLCSCACHPTKNKIQTMSTIQTWSNYFWMTLLSLYEMEKSYYTDPMFINKLTLTLFVCIQLIALFFVQLPTFVSSCWLWFVFQLRSFTFASTLLPKSSFCLTQKTLRVNYNGQLNAAWGNNPCLLWESYGAHKSKYVGKMQTY
jgi:hypothetical protein